MDSKQRIFFKCIEKLKESKIVSKGFKTKLSKLKWIKQLKESKMDSKQRKQRTKAI